MARICNACRYCEGLCAFGAVCRPSGQRGFFLPGDAAGDGIGTFAVVALFVLTALTIGLVRFWRDMGETAQAFRRGALRVHSAVILASRTTLLHFSFSR